MKSWRQGVKRKWQTLLDTPLSREVIDRCGYLVDRANTKSKVWKDMALEFLKWTRIWVLSMSQVRPITTWGSRGTNCTRRHIRGECSWRQRRRY